MKVDEKLLAEIDWPAWRSEFPGLERRTYLNTVSLGQLSNRSRSAVNQFMDLWTELGASAWYSHWLAEVDHLRHQFARLIGSSPDEVAVMPNVSSALAAISSSLNFSVRKRVVCCELDFPTLTYHWLAQAARGVETRILPTDDGVHIPVEAFEQSVDGETALIATSRVYFTSGYIQDVKALADIAHQNGALMLVDDYQGTGQIPIDVKQAGVDVLISGGLKWLIGGPGVAYLYVRRDRVSELEPTITGWFSHARQFDFDPHSLEFRPDAMRFEAGTPSVAAVYAGRAGLEIINEIGSRALRQRTATLTRDLVERLLDRGFKLRIPPDPEKQSGITVVEVEDALDITRALANRDIIVDKRPGAIRIAPYFYNTQEENEIAVSALEAIVSNRG